MRTLLLLIAMTGCVDDHTVAITVGDLTRADISVFVYTRTPERPEAGITFAEYSLNGGRCPIFDEAVTATGNGVALIVAPGSADHGGSECASPELGGFPDPSAASTLELRITDARDTAVMTYAPPLGPVLECTGFASCAVTH